MNTNTSSETSSELLKAALKKILGPGVRARIEADAALPKRFPGNDGIKFDPKWQDYDVAVKHPGRPEGLEVD